MDIRTGELRTLEDALRDDPEMLNHIEVDLNKATEKQRNESKVSLKDNKSKLGKKLQHARKTVLMSKKDRKKFNKKEVK